MIPNEALCRHSFFWPSLGPRPERTARRRHTRVRLSETNALASSVQSPDIRHATRRKREPFFIVELTVRDVKPGQSSPPRTRTGAIAGSRAGPNLRKWLGTEGEGRAM